MSFTLKSLKFYLLISVIGVILSACNSGSNSGGSSSNATYTKFNCPGQTNVSPPGVSGVDSVEIFDSKYYITGVYSSGSENQQAFVYNGDLSGNGTCESFNYKATYQNVTNTYLYTPSHYGFSEGELNLVGSYTTNESGATQFGFLYTGPESGSGTYLTLTPSESLEGVASKKTIATASANNAIVVGYYTTDLESHKSFIYDITTRKYFAFESNLNIQANAVRISESGGDTYTIVGNYYDNGVSKGFIADWDSSTNTAVNFTSFTYSDNGSTTFNGVISNFTINDTTRVESIYYDIAANWTPSGSSATSPLYVEIQRNTDGSFGQQPQWVPFNGYPGASATIANAITFSLSDTNSSISILGYYQQGSPLLDYGYIATLSGIF